MAIVKKYSQIRISFTSHCDLVKSIVMAAAAVGSGGGIDVLYVIIIIIIIITVCVYSCCGENRERKKRNLEVYNPAALAWTDDTLARGRVLAAGVLVGAVAAKMRSRGSI